MYIIIILVHTGHNTKHSSHSDEETDNFYIFINKFLESKANIVVMGDFKFNANVGGQTNTPERVT